MRLGATDIEELATTLNTLFNEKFPLFKAYSGPATLKTGEWALQTKTGETLTLPAAGTANQGIVITCGPEAVSVKVTTSGGAFIYGDFVNKEATITLTSLQHVVLQSNGLNWFILAGEPRREAKYTVKLYTKVQAEPGVEPSATRPAIVALVGVSTGGQVEVGGVGSVGWYTALASATVWVQPGEKGVTNQEVQTYTRLL